MTCSTGSRRPARSASSSPAPAAVTVAVPAPIHSHRLIAPAPSARPPPVHHRAAGPGRHARRTGSPAGHRARADGPSDRPVPISAGSGRPAPPDCPGARTPGAPGASKPVGWAGRDRGARRSTGDERFDRRRPIRRGPAGQPGRRRWGHRPEGDAG
ncbi:hypothetical protein VM98_17635 [Streptomyces rubellomurinus subsp. indigoferus]|nr:hypothetical protein VM98_17635 [Streptomyces rubellomurinus subsp. indigoferus]